MRQKQRKGKSELGEQLQEKLLVSYAHFAYKHETVQKHAKVKPLFKIKEEIKRNGEGGGRRVQDGEHM